MKIAVLSGKGGTGKTLVSVNLAAVAEKGGYFDCDVEEPNGHLFLKPSDIEEEEVTSLKPVVDMDTCDGCRVCVDACVYKALAYIPGELMIFDEICHACGLCTHLCPRQALTETKRVIGTIRRGRRGSLSVHTGTMHIGESTGVPIIKELLKKLDDDLSIIDSPPGSGCLVLETIAHADYCILVAEPTIFGAQNLALVHELTQVMNKPAGVLLNKVEDGINPSELYAKEKTLKILGSLPYDSYVALENSNAELLVERSEKYRTFFLELLKEVVDEATLAAQR
ncbi:MAG: ATPase [Sphaerochaeta sp.]|jgi:MinD superfamily P-loop ATPase|nr:ATP-binding protein [Spirochaetota bacterium]TAH56184.1 MAG: ATPase [Sphaerochaeta sp.]